MEIFEQFRLLLIVIMAFLSYRYVNTNLSLPPSLSEQEQEDVQAGSSAEQLVDSGSNVLQGDQVEQLPPCDEFVPPVEDIQEIDAAEVLNANGNKSSQEQMEENWLEEELEASNDALGEIQNLQEKDDNEKVTKTKRIRKDWKRATKKSTQTIHITDNLQSENVFI